VLGAPTISSSVGRNWAFLWIAKLTKPVTPLVIADLGDARAKMKGTVMTTQRGDSQ
jgi:hypothetical protein